MLECKSTPGIKPLVGEMRLRTVLALASVLALAVVTCRSRCEPRADSVAALERGLRFLTLHRREMNVDAFFGVFLAHVELSIEGRGGGIARARTLARRILEHSPKHKIMDFQGWKSLLARNRTELTCDPTVASAATSSQPDERSSDACLGELTGACFVSAGCRAIMSRDDARGYATAHKLLYWLTCGAMSCSQCSQGALLSRLCCSAEREALAIEELGFPRELRDLFMEQAVVCAMSGFAGTLSPGRVRAVVSWQDPSGCWGKPHGRTRRSSVPLGPERCSSHETAVAIALLAASI